MVEENELRIPQIRISTVKGLQPRTASLCFVFGAIVGAGAYCLIRYIVEDTIQNVNKQIEEQTVEMEFKKIVDQ